MDINAVSVKLPEFWSTSPEAWFIQAEAQFALRKVTCDDTRYYYVVAALDSATAARSLSVLNNPPQEGKYQFLKDFLLSAYGLTETDRAAQLFNIQGLGDRKPSELMDYMLSLLGPHEPCFIFKHMFLQHLPESIKTPLSLSTSTDPRQLAKEADKLFASLQSSSQQLVSTVCASETDRGAEPPTVNAINSSNRHSNSRDLCRYHFKFGKKAFKCEGSNCPFYQIFLGRKRQGNGKEGQ